MRNIYSFSVFVLLLVLFALPVVAQDPVETLVVTPGNLRGWSTADTRPGGASALVLSSGAPRGTGALRLTTDATNAAKAQFMRAETALLSEVLKLSYHTKQVNAPLFYGADASFQLVVNLCGPTSGFTTMVYEPYQNGVVTPGVWQFWDVSSASGNMWSSRSVTCGLSTVTAGAGGPPFYSLDDLKVAFPNAVIIGYGVNVGTYNPSYNVEVDLARMNDTQYDFEVYSTPSHMDECKNGGWSTFAPPSGPYKNQGQCVSATVGNN